MPRLVDKPEWERAAARSVKRLAKTAQISGLSVKAHLGKVRLRFRPPGEKEQGVPLPFQWSEHDWDDAYTRIRNIVALMREGHSLKAAADIADGRSQTSRPSWEAAVNAYEIQKTQFGNAIQSKTWNSDYKPPLTELISLMEQKDAPRDGNEVIECLVIRYDPGSRTRNIRVDSVTSFLKYCVERLRFADAWRPTESRAKFVGRKPKDALDYKADPLADVDILKLIAELSGTEAGQRWSNVLKLMAVYGLRGIAEVAALETRVDPRTKEPYMFCCYEKRSGKGVTKPRKVRPLPLLDADGKEVDWQLLELMVNGRLLLPSLQDKYSMQTFLRRKSVWTELKKDMASHGLNLQGKSFRDSYSLRAHEMGVSAEHAALSMGHSLETHLRHYPWADGASADRDFERARNARKT